MLSYLLNILYPICAKNIITGFKNSMKKGNGEFMNISFCSTYRVPITQPGVNNAKKEKLRQLAQEYDGLISSSKTGALRVSLPNELDGKFEQELKNIGYKQYQKFDGENIPADKIDKYIRISLGELEYEQKGKQKKGKIREKELFN